MVSAGTAAEIDTRRKAFLRKWRLGCSAVADTLEEAGDRLFTFNRLETQTVLPCAETVPMLLWALMASGQIQMRKGDGWETLSRPIAPTKPPDQPHLTTLGGRLRRMSTRSATRPKTPPTTYRGIVHGAAA